MNRPGASSTRILVATIDRGYRWLDASAISAAPLTDARRIYTRCTNPGPSSERIVDPVRATALTRR